MRSHLQHRPSWAGPAQVLGAELGLAVSACALLAAAASGAWPADARLEAPAPVKPTAAARMIPAPAPARATTAAGAAGVIRLQDLTPAAARLWNAANPVSRAPNPAALPFHLAAEGVLDETRATDCMTAAVYYEAGFESLEGKRAVAQVVINRLRHPLFPKTVCGVVFQGAERPTGCQFTFTCDGALARRPQDAAWDRARSVALAALHGYVMQGVGNATHYHADYVAPYWSPALVKVAVVGQHIFYRWTGGLGLPPAFAGRYAGGEMAGMQIAALDRLARVASGDAAAPTGAPDPPSEVAVPPAEPAVKPAVAAAVDASALVTTEAAAHPATPVLTPDQLDWQGRPRRQSPPRLAMPTAGAGGF